MRCQQYRNFDLGHAWVESVKNTLQVYHFSKPAFAGQGVLSNDPSVWLDADRPGPNFIKLFTAVIFEFL